MRKLLIVAALVGFVVLAVPGPAMAVCANSDSTADGLGRARAVFVGEVIDVEDNGRTAVVDVKSVWKGVGVYEQVTVHGESDDATGSPIDDLTFQLGVTYLVASNTAAAPYRADRCTVTRPWTGIPSVIPNVYQAAVGATIGSSPDPVPAAAVDGGTILDSPLVPIATGLAVAVGFVLLLGRIARGPGHSTGGGPSSSSSRRSRGRRRSRVRGPDGSSGRFRRSGVSQADKLRGIRGGKKGRKDAKRSRVKTKKTGLRTDRLDSSADGEDRKERTRV